MSKKENETPERELCIEGKCFDTHINIKAKEIRFIPKEDKECQDLEALNNFVKLYKDPTAKMKLIERVIQIAEKQQKP